MKRYPIFISLLALTLLSGCLYKMPTDRNICTLPNTNNPAYTRERPPSLGPK